MQAPIARLFTPRKANLQITSGYRTYTGREDELRGNDSTRIQQKRVYPFFGQPHVGEAIRPPAGSFHEKNDGGALAG